MAPLLRRLISLLAVPVLVAGLLVTVPHPADAASGGRIGGGSFRSSPSMPRSYGGGGYRGGYGGGFGGGGFGFPFIVPIFGFGGGGLFGFLILMAVVGLLVNALRGGGEAPGLGGGGARPSLGGGSVDGPVTIAQVQVGLLASARSLQSDLRRLAGQADTSSSAGLQRVLQETSLSLLRHPDLWVYASAEDGQVPFANAEATFNRLSMRQRSKLRQELTSNVGGQRFNSGSGGLTAGGSDAASDYLVVTLLLASRRRLSLPAVASAEQLRDALQRLGSIGAEELIALEVIWQPEGEGESLSAEELVTEYPDLQHL